MRRLQCVAATVLLMLGVVRAGATTLRLFSLEALAARSDAVVRGTVAGSRAQWRGSVIHTLTTVRVSEVLRGSAPAHVDVVQLGGRIGDDLMPVAGVAQLSDGEPVVLFLRASPVDGEFFLAGMSQGKWSLRPDGTVWSLPTAPVWDGARVGPPTGTSLTLDELRARLRGRP